MRSRKSGGFPCFWLLVAGLLLPATAQSQTYFSRANGNWNVNATWSTAACAGAAAASFPSDINNHNVQICNGHDVTIPAGVAATARSVTINAQNGSGQVIHAAATSTLAVGAGGVTINGPTNVNTNAWRINAGSGTVAGSVTLVEGTNNNRIANITITTGSLAISGTAGNNGNLSMTNANNNARTTITMSGGAGNLTLTGSFTLSSTFGTLTPGTTSTMTFTSGSAATIASGTGIAYANLTVNKPGGTATLTGNETVAGNLTVSAGTLDLGTFTLNRSAAGGTITVSDGATLKIGGTNTFPANYTTHTLGAASTIEYSGTNQTVGAEGAPGYGHLTLSGSGVKTLPGAAQAVRGNFTLSGTASATAANALTIGGNMVLGAGTTFTAGSFTHRVAGNFSNNGAAFTATGSTFEFNGTAAQAIGGAAASTTFNPLSVSNTAAAVTAGHPLTVTGTLTLAASAALADGGNTITVNGDIANAGSHTGAGRILLTGGAGAHTLSGGGSYTNLELNDVNGAVLSANATVNGTLTFTSGNLGTTAANTLTLGAAGTISGAGTSRHVTGNLAKTFSAATAFTYALGDGSSYTPVAVTFGAPVTGNLTAAVTNADHPNTTAGTSGVDSSKSINRYWTLKNPTVSGTATAAFTYINGTPVDRDSGATAASFGIRRGTSCSGSGGGRNCASWGAATVSGTPSNTQATATGVAISSGDPEADFVVGEAASTKFSREREFIYTRELY